MQAAWRWRGGTVRARGEKEWAGSAMESLAAAASAALPAARAAAAGATPAELNVRAMPPVPQPAEGALVCGLAPWIVYVRQRES